MIGSNINKGCGKYGKLLVGLLDNGVIVSNVEDIWKAENIEKAGDVGKKGDIGKVGDAEKLRDIGDKKDKEDIRIIKHIEHINEAKNAKDNKAVKCNNRIGNSGDQNNWHTTVENMVDGITNIIDSTDVVFANVLSYLFGFRLPGSNLPSSVPVWSNILPSLSTAWIGQFFLLAILPDTLVANCFNSKF